MVKEEWLVYLEPLLWPQAFEQIVQSWDTASKETQLSDFSVCTTWGLFEKKRYLIDVMRKRLNYPELKRAVVEQIQSHRPQVVLIEDKGSGIQLLQELRHDGFSCLKAINPQGSKTMRMDPVTAQFEGRFVILPIQAHWLNNYVAEITTFPRGKYDDQVDSTSQALSWIQANGREPALLTFLKMRAGS